MMATVALSWIVLCIVVVTPSVQAHGFLSYPVSRNWKRSFNPPYGEQAEYCPHCLAAGGPGTVSSIFPYWPAVETAETSVRHGLCGDSAQSSQTYLSSGPIVAEFKAGAVVTFEVVVTAPHMGHFEFRLCDLAQSATGVVTQDCLNQNQLVRSNVSHTHISPIDSRFPSRYYSDPTCAASAATAEYASVVLNASAYDHVSTSFGSAQRMRMDYQLPSGLTCEHCVLQWWWVTGNTCTPPYYDGMEWPSYVSHCGRQVNTSEYWSSTIAQCGTTYPEEFWNCADISIISDSSYSNDASSSFEIKSNVNPVNQHQDSVSAISQDGNDASLSVFLGLLSILLVAGFVKRYATNYLTRKEYVVIPSGVDQPDVPTVIN